MQKVPIIYSAENIGFSIQGNTILEGVTLDVKQGAYLGIIGPNGGGKTTFLKILLGLLQPTEGKLKRGVDRQRVGYVPQRANAMGEQFPGTVLEIIESGQTPSGVDTKALERAIDAADVEHLLPRLFASLSGGERQRVLIARALSCSPKVLLLDEPTSAVDAKGQEGFYAFLRKLRTELGLTIILVSHDEDVVSHEVEDVLCLNRHLVCHGPVEDVLKHPHVIHGHH